jgi:hypothetical protein
MGGSAAQPIRQPRARLKGQPLEHQHSAAADKEEREKIQSTLKLTGSDLAAAVAAFLVSTFFVALPIAAVIGAIVVKRLGGGVLEEICKKSNEWIKQMG